MHKRSIVAICLGAIVMLLGLLWLLQGSDLVHLKPILCFADCVPLTGRSVTWQIVGAMTLGAGALITVTSLKRLKS